MTDTLQWDEEEHAAPQHTGAQQRGSGVQERDKQCGGQHRCDGRRPQRRHRAAGGLGRDWRREQDADDECDSGEDYADAARFFRTAIDLDADVREAYYYLGFLFQNGFGVTADYKTALTYYK